MPAPILYESHMHTPLCKHAIGLPSEYAAAAEQRGMKGIIVTCHNPIPNRYSASVRMSPEQMGTYLNMVSHTRAEWEGRIDVRLGMECDYSPLLESYLKAFIPKHEFHHVLGSIHPQIGEYRASYFNGDPFAYQKTYFDHLALAAESKLFDTLAHPDLIKNENPEQWRIERIIPFIRHALDRIAATGVAMELNTSGVNKRLPEMNPGPIILQEMAQRGIPVVLGADAHDPRRVGDGYLAALELLATAGFEKVSFFLERKRQEVTIQEAAASLDVTSPQLVA